MARVKSGTRTNADFERLGFKFNDIEQAMLSMSNDMGMLTSNTLLTPEPGIPFKLAEEPDVDGIFPTFVIKVPAQTEVVRCQLIRKSDNVKLATDASDEAAIARARRKIFAFRFEVSEDEAQNGTVERRTDKPIKRRKNPAKNQLQLIRLIALNDKDAFAKNPDANPFEVTTPLSVGQQIFPALVVRDKYDSLDSGHMPDEPIMMDADKRYFNIGTSVAGPSKPALDKIVSNTINLETPQTGDVKTTFRIEANANNNGSANDVSFETAGYNEATVVLQRINPNGTPDPGGVLTFPLAIEDTDQTFVLIDAILPLGARFKWRRNTVGNGTKKEPAVPDMDVVFFAGGQPPTAGIPELQAFTIAVGETDGGFTEVAVQIVQKAAPNLPALLKRIQIFKTNPGGTKKFAGKLPLLDEETVFIAGKTSTFFFQVKHKKNLTGIRFDATLIGINHTEALPITRDASPFMGDSIFAGKPTAPNLNLLVTAPDTDTDNANDSYADFTVGASATDATKTFADVGTDTIFIALRKFNGQSDDDPDDNRIKKEPFPVEDLNATQIVCRVRNLRTGVRYRWPRNIASNSGAIIKSDTVQVEFRAGQMLVDPVNVTISIVSITQEDGNFVVRVRIQQAAAPTMPALLRLVSLFKDRNNGQGFVEIANSRVRIKDNPLFQVAGANQTLDIEINALKNTTAQLRARVTAVGGLTKDSVAVPAIATGGQPPTTLPSIPQAGDIIVNTVQADSSTGIAIVVFRVFASWMRALTGQGGTGQGGSINFNDVSADEAAVVISDASGGQGQEFKAADFDPTQNFADVSAELTIGKAYLYRRNITFRAGVPAKSTAANIPFTAGGRISATNLSELTGVSIQLFQVLDANNQVDNKQVDAQVNFTQPVLPVLIKRIEFYKKRNNDAAFKLVGGERLLDDISYQQAGSKSFNKPIQVPANATFNIQAIIIGLGDTPTTPVRRTVGPTNAVMPADAGNNDTARPQWGGAPVFPQQTLSTTVPNMRVRYSNNSIIKIKANLPDKQVKSLITCRVAFEFIVQVLVGIPPNQQVVTRIYTWNPETNEFFMGQAGFTTDFGQNGSPNVLRFNPTYFIDIGKGINAAFSVDKPTVSGSPPSATIASFGDIPPTIVNDLLVAFNNGLLRYLQIRAVVINNFDPTSEQASSVGVLSEPSRINFPFTGGDRGPAFDFFTYLP